MIAQTLTRIFEMRPFPNRTFATLTLCAATIGCATQEPNPRLDALDVRYRELSSQPFAAQVAPDELDATSRAIIQGRAADADSDEDAVAHYLVVGNKTLDVAEGRIALRAINETIEASSEKRQAIVLNARERELDAAKAQASMTAAQLREQEARLAQQRQALAAKEARLDSAEAEAQALADQLDELQAEVNERGMVLTLSDIVFDFDSATLKPGSDRSVSKIADFLREHSERKLVIEGFTDAVGSDAYNQRLSERRAASVRDALVAKGIDASRISTAGLGEEHPVASNDTAAGRQLNRRVEIIIGKPQGQDIAERTGG
jgi:outer membrane protein OmpA-like peptidoglycan-associated protein